MSEEQKAIVRLIRAEALSKNRHDLLDGLYADDYAFHGGAAYGELTGPEAFKQLLQGMSQVVGDYVETVEDQIAEANKVVTRPRGHGKAIGELLGVAGNGREFTATAILITAFNPPG